MPNEAVVVGVRGCLTLYVFWLRSGFDLPTEAAVVEVRGCLTLYVFWLPLLCSMD